MGIGKLKVLAKAVFKKTDRILFLFFYKIQFVAIYYFFRADFRREMNSIAAGRVMYESFHHNRHVNYNLRRNIHRIEKGLISSSRRNSFALDYIKQTVDIFSIVREESEEVTNEIQWANDVLIKYFEVALIPKSMSDVLTKFEKYSLPSENNIPNYKEVKELPNISFDSFLRLTKYRSSIRSFKDKPVSKEVIDNAIYAAMQSPSACNRHPIRFDIIQDDALLAKCVELPMGVASFKENIYSMIAVIGRQRAYSEVRDRHVIYVDGGLASMTFMYALEVQGVSSCPINWPDIAIREHKARKLLNLSEDEKIIMWIAVGYASDKALTPCSAKLELGMSRSWSS